MCSGITTRFPCLHVGLTALLLLHYSVSAAELRVSPQNGDLRGPLARQQLLVTLVDQGKPSDRTRQAKFVSETPGILSVSPEGVVRPAGDGTGTIAVTVGEQTTRITLRVRDSKNSLQVTLERDVIPALTRHGCNAGACHGKQRGQGGFQLSLLGFDPDFDHAALTREARGRRIFPASPTNSLLLLKPTAAIAHGGGRRLAPADPAYKLLLRWIETGTPRHPADAPTLERLSVEPAERLLTAGEDQQLIATAHYSDGTREDVTHLASFQSNEAVLAAVNGKGLITAGTLPGEAAVTARFKDKFAICNVLLPLPGVVPPEAYARLPKHNFIDGLVWDKLQRLGLTPSAPTPDATFHRRAYLDIVGRLPTPDETRAFLADKRSDKRIQLIDTLLARPEYADFWANKWADLLRPNPYRVGVKAVYNLDAWLRESFRANKPYDHFVRELIAAKGSTFRDGPTVFLRDRREPEEITTAVSQLFLGVRLECAKCHHHPFEIWGQDDFYSFAAHFAQIGRKGTGISPPISGSEEIVFTSRTGAGVRHPVSGKLLAPRPLLGKSAEGKDGADARETLAAWVTAKENPFFARAIVNRVWADLMGRGLVEPVDDLRATNPPTNAALLDALADDFRKQNYDLKKLIRTMATSYVYTLSTKPEPRNALDGRNYARAYRQRPRAEVLLDMVCDATGVPESFQAMPLGARAMQLWTFRSQSLFLDSFGRPDPNQDPPCERTTDTTVVQALHLMNSPAVQAKVTSDQGRAAELAASKKTDREIVEELYLLTYSRYPTDAEHAVGAKVLARKVPRRQSVEDLLWALMNTPEFVFRD